MKYKVLTAAIVLASGTTVAQKHQHSEAGEIEEVNVKAHPLHEKGLSQSIDVLRGSELSDALQSSLGATLAAQPGIRSANFGAAVGRPVIHGLGGPRVKTTQDQIDTLDVSVTSTDHAVAVEPFIAEQITILKGASTLLYGSGAIGGVVDIETGRIPEKRNEDGTSGRLELRAGDNQDTRTGAGRLDGNLGSAFAWHLDAFSKESDDYDIPGFAESKQFRAAEEAEAGGEEGEGEEEAFGVLEGSRYDIQGGAVGLSWVGERGHLGLAVSTIDGSYGLVGGHEEEEEGEEGEEEGVGIIELEQTRIDLSGELLSPISFVEALSFRIGINDYEHSEIEGNGELGTFFENDAWEARLHAKHEPISGFTGVAGVQLGDRDFSAVGEEAFVAPAETETSAIYWAGEREFNDFSLELGARSEKTDIDGSVDGVDMSRSFNSKSASIGFVIPQSETMSWTVLFDYAERAPSIEELFSFGPHLATSRFEIGDPNLNEESAFNISLSWEYEAENFDAHINVYRYDFDDFIYTLGTGEEDPDEGLLIFNYEQDNAEFIGLDIELGLHLLNIAGGDLDLQAAFDTVAAEIKTGDEEDLPQIPSDRFSTSLVWDNGDWHAKLTYTDVSTQNDVSPLELTTDGYSDVSAKLERSFKFQDSVLKAFIQGRNLTDEEQREHVSFVKDLAPLPGRSLEVGVQYSF